MMMMMMIIVVSVVSSGDDVRGIPEHVTVVPFTCTHFSFTVPARRPSKNSITISGVYYIYINVYARAAWGRSSCRMECGVLVWRTLNNS